MLHEMPGPGHCISWGARCSVEIQVATLKHATSRGSSASRAWPINTPTVPNAANTEPRVAQAAGELIAIVAAPGSCLLALNYYLHHPASACRLHAARSLRRPSRPSLFLCSRAFLRIFLSSCAGSDAEPQRLL